MSRRSLPRARSSWSTLILCLLAVAAVIVVARDFLTPVILAFLLSLTFSPIRRWMQRRGVPPVVSSVLVVATLLAGTAGLVYALSGPVQDYAENGRAIMTDVERKLRGLSDAIERVAEASEEVGQMTAGDEPGPEPERVVVDGPSLLTRVALTAPAVATQVLFTLVLLFFLTASGDMFYEKLVQASPTFSDKKRAIQIAYDIERKLSRYFLTITVINAALGILVGLSLWAIGMPNPLLFGVLAFVLNFIPFLGAVVGMIVTTAIAIVSFDTLGQAALAGGLYLFWTSVEGQVVTPYAVGRSLKLNPVLVFLAVAFWGWAWSVIGMFIAVPILIALRVFSENIPALGNLGIFLAGRDAEESP